MPTILVSASSIHMHKPIDEHPENPGRILRITRELDRAGIPYMEVRGACTESEALGVLSRVHSKEYVDRIIALGRSVPLYIDSDTYLSNNSVELAMETACTSYRLAFEGAGRVVFYIARPPGHHAGLHGRAKGARTQGFCIFNNAAAAVQGFLDGGFKKPLVIDFDAHYGNGTMEILYDKRILQVDLHQDTRSLPVFPRHPSEIGRGEGYGYKVGIPLLPGTGDDSYIELVGIVRRVIDKYMPDSLVVSAGFDSFTGDGLTDLSLGEYSYYELGRMISELSVPTVIVLEGGYTVGLSKGVKAFIKGLNREPTHYSRTSSATHRVARINMERAVKIINRVEKYIG